MRQIVIISTGLTVYHGGFHKHREMSLRRLNSLARLRNLDLQDTSIPLGHALCTHYTALVGKSS